MEKVIVTGLLIIGGVAAAAVVIFAIGSSASSSGQSMAASQQEDSVRTRTSIAVIAVASRPDGTKVDAWVKKVGVAPIAAIEKSDLFLIQPGARYDALTYNNDGVTSKTWYADLKEAGLPWNRSDTLHITITLSLADGISTTVPADFILRMSTPNGKTAEEIFGSHNNWWKSSWTYRQQLTVTTGVTSPSGGYNGYTVRLTGFDTAALVPIKMQTDCDDLRVIWWDRSTPSHIERVTPDPARC